jgi:hypothetical protein
MLFESLKPWGNVQAFQHLLAVGKQAKTGGYMSNNLCAWIQPSKVFVLASSWRAEQTVED